LNRTTPRIRDSAEQFAKKLQRIRSWASGLAAEDDPPERYLCPTTIKQLVVRLKTSPRSLDFVLALQGTGKSAAACYLESLCGESIDPPRPDGAAEDSEPTLHKVVRWKWKEPGRFYQQFADSIVDCWPGTKTQLDLVHNYESRLIDKLFEVGSNSPSLERRLNGITVEERLVDANGQRFRVVTLWGALAGVETKTNRSDVVKSAMSLLPDSKREAIRKEALLAIFEYVDAPNVIVIDTPDYRRKDARLISRDLGELSGFFQELVSHRWEGHLVVFIQKELYGGHFFEGKGFRFEIAPFAPEELVRYYQESFGDRYPFTVDAILLVARLSRGVFRRYKRYILLCLEKWETAESSNRGDDIDANLVRAAVTEDELTKDLELELGKLFPREESTGVAARTISVVAKNPEPVNQKTLAEALGASQDVIGRILGTLEVNGYIKRENTAVGKVVSLA
jgi:MarR family